MIDRAIGLSLSVFAHTSSPSLSAGIVSVDFRFVFTSKEKNLDEQAV